jgi:hypothetical protein
MVLCAENKRLMDIFTQTTLEDIVKSLEKGERLDGMKGESK